MKAVVRDVILPESFCSNPPVGRSSWRDEALPLGREVPGKRRQDEGTGKRDHKHKWKYIISLFFFLVLLVCPPTALKLGLGSEQDREFGACVEFLTYQESRQSQHCAVTAVITEVMLGDSQKHLLDDMPRELRCEGPEEWGCRAGHGVCVGVKAAEKHIQFEKLKAV